MATINYNFINSKNNYKNKKIKKNKKNKKNKKTKILNLSIQTFINQISNINQIIIFS